MKNQNRQRIISLRLGLILGLILPALLVAQTDEVEVEQEIVALTPFEVSEEEDRGWASLYTLGATRINTSLDKVAVSVLIANKEFLDDLAPINFNEAAEWFSGIHKTSTPGVNQMIMRGQALSSSATMTFRDGIKAGQPASFHIDPFVLERLEIIKGPAGVLFGTHVIGGLINQVWKAPHAENRTSIGFRSSSYDTYGGYIDTNRVWGSDNKLRSRTLISYKDGHSRHGGKDYEFTLTPMFTYMIDEEDNTSLTFRYHFQDYHFAEARGIWFHDADKVLPFGVIPNDVPMSNLADPEVGRQSELHDFELNFKHSFDMFGTRWHGRIVGRFRDHAHQFRIYLTVNHALADSQGNVFLNEAGEEELFHTTATFAKYNQLKAAGVDVDIIVYPNAIARTRQENYDQGLLAVDLNTEFDLGPSRHRVFTYLNWESLRHKTLNRRHNWDAEKQSVFTIQPRNPAEVLSNYRNDNATQPRNQNIENFAWAIQDSISFFEDRVLAVAGLRYDYGTGTSAFGDGTTSGPESNDALTTKFGFVGKPWEGVSIFYNKSETFIPQSGTNQLGDPFDNQWGLQDEVGVKLYLWDNRLTMTWSWFNIDFTNQKVGRDFLDPEEGFISITTQEGTAVTDGWEADLIIEPIDGLTFMIGLTDIDSGRVDANTGEIKKQRGVPTGFQYSVFGKYTFQGGPLQGFYAGLGLKHITDNRPGDFSDSYRVPGYDLWKAIFGYRRGPWRVNVMINNLNDAEYIVTSVARFLMTPGESRAYGLTVDYTF